MASRIDVWFLEKYRRNNRKWKDLSRSLNIGPIRKFVKFGALKKLWKHIRIASAPFKVLIRYVSDSKSAEVAELVDA